jgi:hypothetical protein
MKEWNAFMQQILAGEFDVSASHQRIQNAIPSLSQRVPGSPIA